MDKWKDFGGWDVNVFLVVTVIGVVLSGAVIGVIGVSTFLKVINTSGVTGSIGVQVYSDVGLTTVINSIDWGVILPNDTVWRDTYVKNVGSVPVSLVISVVWLDNASASVFDTFDSYDASILMPNDVLPVSFGVTAGFDLSGVSSFAYDIHITAVQEVI